MKGSSITELGKVVPPSKAGGDQEISTDEEVTSTTARLVTSLGGTAGTNK